jgi:hypothetical protein
LTVEVKNTSTTESADIFSISAKPKPPFEVDDVNSTCREEFGDRAGWDNLCDQFGWRPSRVRTLAARASSAVEEIIDDELANGGQAARLTPRRPLLVLSRERKQAADQSGFGPLWHE